MHSQPKKMFWFLVAGLIASLTLTPVVFAHHGWGWATQEEFEVEGRIVAVRLGNPHGELTLEVGDQRWVVEVGQPWRNERAGLTDDLLQVGQRIKAHGHRSSRPGERLVKAERVVIDGRSYNLYPDRTS